ncbi:hypothetical protein L6475_11335 [Prevotella sp. E9-3]|uniref:hypothetical protein n=1 Tax=Prevotella sp. E9-3 TaxID=2913621 RepID=UPI001EDC4B86|nr:hypothetical protein [Prevotella sp. E9-3]UKK47800.1 hypothetical protein L6475_11335 [Prevotella sp. E9-3]
MSTFAFIPGTMTRITFEVGVVVPVGQGIPRPRSPLQAPNVALGNYTLFFETDHPSFTLVLLDEEGEEVYSAVAPSDVDSVTLPSTLTGDYELQLYDGSNYYYYCEITF